MRVYAPVHVLCTPRVLHPSARGWAAVECLRVGRQACTTWTTPAQRVLAAGCGRAGSEGRLISASGGRYVGGITAGQPEGWGRYYMSGVSRGMRGKVLAFRV
jgi:hypothetical protein